MANKTIPLMLFGIGAWLLYSGIKNESPIPLLGSLFGFTAGTAAKPTTAQAEAAAVAALPANATQAQKNAAATSAYNAAGYQGPAVAPASS